MTVILHMLMILMFCMGAIKLEAEAGLLAPDEVDALLEIATQVGKKDWNNKVDPCSNETSWVTPRSSQRPMFDNKVVCNCSFGGVCHIASIFLKGQDLAGSLPKSIVKLPYLTHLDLWANYLSGNIPPEWANTKLEILEIQAGGFSGPIPLNISLLNSLTQLRISDLLGDGSEFPNLESMQNMTYLMLSNCNLSGSFPRYLTEMKQLKVLDLSFNRLKGDLPADYNDLKKSLEIIYVTGNMLSGPIPPWIQSRNTRTAFDLSYNNFTEITTPTNCKETLNLFKSSWGGNYSKPVECLSDYCSKDQYSVHINCGGSETTVGNTIYEADDEPGGATKYVPKREVWQISTTGHVWDVEPSEDDYIAQNMSILRMNNSQLYTKARLTPLSLTYHARSLQQNGDIMELVDPRLGSAFKKKEAARMIKVALLCTIQSPVLRPTMSAVVRMLEGKGDVQELVVDPSTFGDSLRFKSFRGNSDQSSVLSIDETRSLVHSSDRTWDGPSSSSAQDLYPDH